MFRKELEKSKKEELDEAQMSRFLTCDLGFHALLMSLAFNSRMQKSMSETRLRDQRLRDSAEWSQRRSAHRHLGV